MDVFASDILEKLNRRRGQAGVTLLELMIATGLMTIALVLIFGSIVSVSQTRRISESRTVAAEHLSTVLEEVRGLDETNLLAYSAPQLGGLGDQATISVRVFDANGAMVGLPLGAGATEPNLPNPCEVQVVVTWRDAQDHVISQSASTLLALGG